MGEQPFLLVLRAGLVMLVFAIVAALNFPTRTGPLPEGMHTPIMAFELAQSPYEVETMFGPRDSAERTAWADAIDRGNTIDFAMQVAYGAVLFLFARALRQRTSAHWLRAAEALAYVAPVADALENMRMFAITSTLGGDYQSELNGLAWFTWIKWSTLVICLSLFAPVVIKRGTSGRVLALLGCSALVSTGFARVFRGLWAEAMVWLVAFSFLAIFAHAFVEHRRIPPTRS